MLKSQSVLYHHVVLINKKIGIENRSILPQMIGQIKLPIISPKFSNIKRGETEIAVITGVTP